MNCVRSSTFKYRLKSLYSRFSIQLIRLVGHSAVDGADDCTKVCSISKDLSSEKPIFDWPRPRSQDKTENKKYSTIILFNSTTKKKELRIPLYAKTACHRYAFAVRQVQYVTLQQFPPILQPNQMRSLEYQQTFRSPLSKWFVFVHRTRSGVTRIFNIVCVDYIRSLTMNDVQLWCRQSSVSYLNMSLLLCNGLRKFPLIKE